MARRIGLPAILSPRGVWCDVRFEETDCLLCGSPRWTTLLEAEDGDSQGLSFRVVRCDQCGLCFTNPRPDPASIVQFYPPGYGPHRRRPRLVRTG